MREVGMEWLRSATRALAEAARLDPESLYLSEGEASTLLEVARLAAQASGERTNAPLLCFIMGVARGRGAALEEMASAVRRLAGGGAQSGRE